MSHKDRPLPTPPRKRFGGGAREADDAAPLTADRMAQAAAEGRLEEFLRQEIPAGDHAQDLARLMMGMSGMAAADVAPRPAPDPDRQNAGTHEGPAPQPPPEVVRAAGDGDVAELTRLLQAEHARRNPAAAAGAQPPSPAEPSGPPPAAGPGRAGIDAALVDELIRIAADADVTVDWLMLRAVRLYVEEYRRTGRL